MQAHSSKSQIWPEDLYKEKYFLIFQSCSQSQHFCLLDLLPQIFIFMFPSLIHNHSPLFSRWLLLFCFDILPREWVPSFPKPSSPYLSSTIPHHTSGYSYGQCYCPYVIMTMQTLPIVFSNCSRCSWLCQALVASHGIFQLCRMNS